MATARKSSPAGGPRRLTAPAGAAKPAPGTRGLATSSGAVTLEEVLVGFQRSLARATRSSLETARSDWQVGLGQRALYVVDGINVSLAAGVVASVDDAGVVQAMTLDLAQATSKIEFRVQSRPIEAIAGEQLILADLDPLGLQRPRHAMRLTLIGRSEGTRSARQPTRLAPEAGADAGAETPPMWAPLAQRDITLHVVGGDTGTAESFVVTSNAVGQVDITVDALENRIASGERSMAFEALDLISRDDDFFVFADCVPAAGELGFSGKLTSNVLQFWVKRRRAPPAAKARR